MSNIDNDFESDLGLPQIVIRPTTAIGLLDPAFTYELPRHDSLRLIRTRQATIQADLEREPDFVISEDDMDSILTGEVAQQ